MKECAREREGERERERGLEFCKKKNRSKKKVRRHAVGRRISASIFLASLSHLCTLAPTRARGPAESSPVPSFVRCG